MTEITLWIDALASRYGKYTPWLVIGVCLLTLPATPAMAQGSAGPASSGATVGPAATDSPTPVNQPLRQANASGIGSIYCGTGVENGIDVGFGALAGLGLPIVGLYLVVVGVRYLKASTEKQKKQAKDSLTNAAIGFAIIVVAILSPELISKVGTEVGYSFSDCVKPF